MPRAVHSRTVATRAGAGRAPGRHGAATRAPAHRSTGAPAHRAPPERPPRVAERPDPTDQCRRRLATPHYYVYWGYGCCVDLDDTSTAAFAARHR